MNDKNTDGSTGGPTNISPVFFPPNVNEVSWMEFKITPDVLKALTAVQSSLLLTFPPLPTTTP